MSEDIVTRLRGPLQGMIEKLQMKIAFFLPRWLAYWSAIRVIANATQGEYAGQTVPELKAMDALKRWENQS